MRIEKVDARTLLTPKRLDYVVKHRFFRHLIVGDDPDSERVYRWHIEKRTGGNEPRSPKNCIDDYVVACRYLLESIRENGFREDGAVKIGDGNRVIGSGAHRISVCLALRVPILIRRVNKVPRRDWGFEWFSSHGFSGDDLADLARRWAALRDDA